MSVQSVRRAVAAWVLAGGLASGALASAAQASPDRAWVEAVQDGRELRVAAQAGVCPQALVDGTPRRLNLRAGPDADFPVAVCSALLHAKDRHIAVDGIELRLPPRHPQRIVVLGDTGCRVQGDKIQACDDPRAWPFARVARLAAAAKPDLIVHVGDYLYRESACPAADARCAGTPHGDAWTTWSADFFTPAGPLLTAAPWVFVRGNHESCKRAGKGWFRLLDAAPSPPACPTESAAFSVDLGGVVLVIVDSADADDKLARDEGAFRAQVAAGLARAGGEPVWLVTHRPIWAIVPAKLGPIGPLDVPINPTEQAAVSGLDLARVQMVVSGHIHEFEALDFGPSRPPQLVAGTGGDITEDGAPTRMRHRDVEIDGKTADLLQFARFGYLVLDRDGTSWKGAFHDLDDRVIATCLIAERRLSCAPVKVAK
jgi:predicted phosphodiesterase